MRISILYICFCLQKNTFLTEINGVFIFSCFAFFSKIILSGIFIFLSFFLLQKNRFLMLKTKFQKTFFRQADADANASPSVETANLATPTCCVLCSTPSPKLTRRAVAIFCLFQPASFTRRHLLCCWRHPRPSKRSCAWAPISPVLHRRISSWMPSRSLFLYFLCFEHRCS